MAWPTNGTATEPMADAKFEDEFSPFERMSDSESYLSRLECRLAKLKSGPLDSKSVLRGLRSLKESTHLEEDSSGDGFFSTEGDCEVSSLERRLFPSKCPVSAEEAQRLLDSDVLSNTTHQLNSEKTPESEIGR